MILELPDNPGLADQAKEAGFDSPAAYVQHLIDEAKACREKQKEESEPAEEDTSAIPIPRRREPLTGKERMEALRRYVSTLPPGSGHVDDSREAIYEDRD